MRAIDVADLDWSGLQRPEWLDTFGGMVCQFGECFSWCNAYTDGDPNPVTYPLSHLLSELDKGYGRLNTG